MDARPGDFAAPALGLLPPVVEGPVLIGQLDRYPDLSTDTKELDQTAAPRRPEPNWLDIAGELAWVETEVCIHFGRHKQRSSRSWPVPTLTAWTGF